MNRTKIYQPEVVEQVKDLRNFDLTSAQIAKELDLPLKQVNEIITKHPIKITYE